MKEKLKSAGGEWEPWTRLMYRLHRQIRSLELFMSFLFSSQETGTAVGGCSDCLLWSTPAPYLHDWCLLSVLKQLTLGVCFSQTQTMASVKDLILAAALLVAALVSLSEFLPLLSVFSNVLSAKDSIKGKLRTDWPQLPLAWGRHWSYTTKSYTVVVTGCFFFDISKFGPNPYSVWIKNLGVCCKDWITPSQ